MAAACWQWLMDNLSILPSLSAQVVADCVDEVMNRLDFLPTPCFSSDPTPRQHLKFLSLAAWHQLPRWWHPAASVCAQNSKWSNPLSFGFTLLTLEAQDELWIDSKDNNQQLLHILLLCVCVCVCVCVSSINTRLLSQCAVTFQMDYNVTLLDKIKF